MRFKVLLAFLLGIVAVGCTSYPREYVRQQFGCEISSMGLWDTTRSENRPELKTVYPHGNNKLLRVFQVLDGAVLINSEMDFWERENFKQGYLPEKKLNLYIETPDKYVDGEYLLHGLYEYIGTHSYKTTSGAQATVRKYRKLLIK
jgi:hypothetical protein